MFHVAGFGFGTWDFGFSGRYTTLLWAHSVRPYISNPVWELLQRSPRAYPIPSSPWVGPRVIRRPLPAEAVIWPRS